MSKLNLDAVSLYFGDINFPNRNMFDEDRMMELSAIFHEENIPLYSGDAEKDILEMAGILAERAGFDTVEKGGGLSVTIVEYGVPVAEIAVDVYTENGIDEGPYNWDSLK